MVYPSYIQDKTKCGTEGNQMYHISNDKRSKQSVQLIIEALLQSLNRLELNEITIKDLCENARVGRVTFYRHFDTIDDVLRKHCDDRFDLLKQYLKDFYKQSHTEPFLKPFLQYWYQDSQILEILIRNNKQDMIREALMRMIQTMKRGSEKSDLLNDYHIAVQSAVAIAVLSKWIENSKNVTPDVLTHSILKALKEPVNIIFEN
jgi:AcrR family transcriptional regulator